MRKNTVAIFMIVTAAALYGFLGFFNSIFNENGYSSADVAFIRSTVPILPLLIVLLSVDVKAIKVKLKDLWVFFAIGACKAATDLCLFKSMSLVPISVASVLEMTAALIVVIVASVIYRLKLTKKKVASTVICIAGAALVTGMFSGTGSIEVTGIGAGMMSAVFYAAYILVGELSVKRGYKPYTSLFYAMIFGCICLLPFSDPVHLTQGMSNPTVYTSMIMIGIGMTLLPAALLMCAYRFIDSGTVSTIAVLETPFAAVVGFFLMSQELDAPRIAGMAMIIAALIMLQMDFKDFREKLKGGKESSAPRVTESRQRMPRNESVLLRGMRMEIILSLAGVLLMVTCIATSVYCYKNNDYGMTKACICGLAYVSGAAYYFAMSSKARNNEIDPRGGFCAVLGCIGGITLFTGVFGLVYDVPGSILEIVLGIMYLVPSYRLGVGGEKERRAALYFLVLVLIFNLAVGIHELRSEGYLFIGICDILTPLLCAFFMTDRNIMLKINGVAGTGAS